MLGKGFVIPILACSKKDLSLLFRSVNSAHIDDDNLEQRLVDSINVESRGNQDKLEA